MFHGRFDHTIDPKGRLSIPMAFRVEIQRRSEKPPVLTTDKGCLALYPHEDWVEFERRLMEADQMDPDVQDVTRFFLTNAVDAPIDSQGRVLVPKHLRAHADLERDVTVSGMSRRIEIWNTTALDGVLTSTYEQLDAKRRSVSPSRRDS